MLLEAEDRNRRSEVHLLIAIVGVPREARDMFMRRLLKEQLAKYDIEIIKSYTTEARMSDEDYRYHVFISEEEFRRRRREGEFFHVERLPGGMRGFRRKDFEDVLADGNAIALFDRLPNGQVDMLRSLPGDLTVLRPFLDEPPLGVGKMPEGMFFQKTGDGNGEPN